MKFFKLVLLILLIGEVGFAQKFSNEFLAIGIDARARAMGNATVASTNTVTAGFWNPAALATIEEDGIQVGAMHTEQFAGVAKHDYLGAVLPLRSANRKIGISLIRFGIDDIPNTLSLFEEDGTINFDNVVPFSAADYALFFSYGQRVNTNRGNLFVGGNAKVIYRQIGSFASSWGFGLDAAALYKINDWKFGLVVRDASTTFNAWSFSLSEQERNVLSVTGNDLPINSVERTQPQITLGIARQFTLNQKWSLLTELNAIATTDGKRNTLISADPISADIAFGVEFGFKELLYLRAGINNFQKDDNLFTQDFLTIQPNIGIGLHIAPFRVDYAFTDVGEQRNQTFSHVISLIFDIRRKRAL